MEKRLIERRRVWLKFKVKLSGLGFRELSEWRKSRDLVRRSLVAPKVSRIQELKNQTIFCLEIDGYIIEILTSFDERIGDFTKAGRVSIFVAPFVKEGLKKNKPMLWRHFHRRGDFLYRAGMMAELLIDRLEKRPADFKGDLMDLNFDNKMYYVWVSGNDKLEIKPFFPSRKESFYDYGREWKRYIKSYENFRNKKFIETGKKMRRAKDIRKSWKQKTSRRK